MKWSWREAKGSGAQVELHPEGRGEDRPRPNHLPVCPILTFNSRGCAGSTRGEIMHQRTVMGLLLTLALVFAVPAFTQDTSTINGRVLDPTGAVGVGAQVMIVNTATNI